MTAEDLDALSPSACAIADRMLGSASEAEDVGQEGFLRFHGPARTANGSSRRAPTCRRWSRGCRWTTSARCGPARDRRGEWLSEPLVISADDNPARKAEMADCLSASALGGLSVLG
jgi:RNA polymerase sigma-70 factor (ECF subfamily)